MILKDFQKLQALTLDKKISLRTELNKTLENTTGEKATAINTIIYNLDSFIKDETISSILKEVL